MSFVVVSTIVGIFVFSCIVKWFRESRRISKHLDLLPNLPRHCSKEKITELVPCSISVRLYGVLHIAPKIPGPDHLPWIQEQVVKYKTCFVMYLFRQPMLTICHPSVARHVLIHADPKPRSLGSYELAFPWLGDGLTLSGGAKWKQHRRLLTPAFHFDILKTYFGVYNEAAEKYANNLESFATSRKAFDVLQLSSACTMDVMMQTIMATENDAQDLSKGQHPYIKAQERLIELYMYRAFHPLTWINWMFRLTKLGKEFFGLCDFVHQVSRKVLKKRRALLKDEGADAAVDKSTISVKRNRLAFIDILLRARDDEGNGLSDEEILNEIDTFMFAGTDTTAAALTFFFYTMATNPEWQQRCFEEVRALFDTGVKQLGPSEINQLETLSLCLKEALRLYPIAPTIDRVLDNDVTVPWCDIYPDDTANQDKTLLLPKGTLVQFSLYNYHHNPYIWGDDHNEFRPERFDENHELKKHPYAYAVFSAGPRNCIGQNFAYHEIKVVVAILLNRFKFILPENHKPVKVITHGILRAEGGIHLHVSKRQ